MSVYTPLNNDNDNKEPVLTYSVKWNTLCSGALTSLGREGTTNYLTDGTSDALLCRTFLPEAVAAASSYFDWTFLRKSKDLSYDTTVTTGPYHYAYALPVDMARLNKVETYNNLPFDIIGRTVWTDSESCSILYQALPTLPDTLPQSFLTAIEHYLTFLLAKPLSGNDSIKTQEWQLYQYWIEQAVNIDRAWLRNSGDKWWTDIIDG